MPKILEVVGSEDIKRIVKNTQGVPSALQWRSGSTAYLMSAEQDDKAFEGLTLDWFWIDEPVRRSIWIALLRGVMKSGGRWWMSATLLEEPWITEEIYEPGLSGEDEDIDVFEGSTDDNEYLSDIEKEKFFKRLTDDEIQTRRYGKPSSLRGRVFKSLDSEKNIIPSFNIPSHWPVYVAIDPHKNKPHAVLFLAVSPKGDFYVCNEIFVVCDIYELAQHIIDLEEQYCVVQRLIDTSAQEDDWTKKSAREMLLEPPYKLHTKLAQKKNKKTSGIIQINQYLKNSHAPAAEERDSCLYIMEHCKRTIREMKNQRYKKNKRDAGLLLEEPEKKWDDMCFVSGTKVATPFGDRPIEEMKIGDSVITPTGIKRVFNAGPTRECKVVKKIGLEGTPHHPIFTWGKGFIDLDKTSDTDAYSHICMKELIRFYLQKQLCLTGSLTDLWGRKDIIYLSKEIRKREKTQKGYMSRCMSFIRERGFRKTMLFTIKTAIALITILTILSVYRLSNTIKCLKTWIKKSKERFLMELGTFLRPGTLLQKEKNGTLNTLRKFGLTEQSQRSFAKHAQSLFWRPYQKELSFAAAPVKTNFTSNLKIVYNLTIEDNSVYYANGILVHNTDALRYILTERPRFRGVAQIIDPGPLYQRT